MAFTCSLTPMFLICAPLVYVCLFYNEYTLYQVFKDAPLSRGLGSSACLKRGEVFESHHMSRCGFLSEQWAHKLAFLDTGSSIKHKQTHLSH